MDHNAKQYIAKVSAAVGVLLDLADTGDAVCNDDGCRVLFGVVRDSAYRIQRELDREVRNHQVTQLLRAIPDHSTPAAPADSRAAHTRYFMPCT